MAILTETLSVWEVGFRWANVDPRRLRFGIPLPVRDNFRLMMHAILHGRLDCDMLSLSKWREEDGEDMRPFFIRYHLDKVEACIAGTRFDRKLLKWAGIDRGEFKAWCERQGIPLPEFWFPPGWKLEYEWPVDEFDSESEPDTAEEPALPHRSIYQRRCIACQVIAEKLWKEHPETTIADMMKHELIRNYGGGVHQADEVVMRWLRAVAPTEVSAKRGRPRKDKGNG